MDEARAAKDRLLTVVPGQNLRMLKAHLPSVNAERLDRFVDGLRKAGVPELPPDIARGMQRLSPARDL
jgi:hypothetical protein